MTILPIVPITAYALGFTMFKKLESGMRGLVPIPMNVAVSIILWMAMVILPGCRKGEENDGRDQQSSSPEHKESSASKELKEAGKHVQEAGKIARDKANESARKFGDLLTESWSEARDGTYDVKDDLEAAYRRNLESAKQSRKNWAVAAKQKKSELLDQLTEKITIAEEKLQTLRSSSEENWETTRRAFNVAWEELRDAVQKARAEFDQSSEKPRK